MLIFILGLLLIAGIYLYHASRSTGPVATITTIEGRRHHTEYKEVEGRPGWVQVFVDGQPGYVFPKEPLDWPTPDV